VTGQKIAQPDELLPFVLLAINQHGAKHCLLEPDSACKALFPDILSAVPLHKCCRGTIIAMLRSYFSQEQTP